MPPICLVETVPQQKSTMVKLSRLFVAWILLFGIKYFHRTNHLLVSLSPLQNAATKELPLHTDNLKSLSRHEKSHIRLDPKRQNRTFFFVHLGKAGGSTLTLNVRTLCNQKRNKRERRNCAKRIDSSDNEMILSRRIIGRMHDTVWNPKSAMKRATSWLWVVRDPFDRLSSAFYAQHVENSRSRCDHPSRRKDQGYEFYCLCFRHVQDWITELASPNETMAVLPNSNKTVSCTELGRNMILGINRVRRAHVNMNFGYYKKQSMNLFPSKEVAVVRTEHMWDDLQQIEHWLGGNASVNASTQVTDTHGSEKFALKSKISDPQTLQFLCCFIQSEAKIYVELIRKAVNLLDWQKNESLTAFSKRCNLDLCSPR